MAFFNAYLAEHAPLLCLCSTANKRINASYRIRRSLPVGKTQFFNPLVWRRIYKVVKRERATHLILEFPYHGIAGVLCQRLLKTKLIVHAHNVEYLRFKEGGSGAWRWLYRLEKWTLRKADAVFFTTEEDLNTARKSFGLKEEGLTVAPYGAEEKKGLKPEEARATIRHRHGLNEEEVLLLFAGTLDYKPNADAVVAIVERLIPLLNETALQYRIIVCGRNRFAPYQFLKALKNDRLIMAGEVPDVGSYFAAAGVFINPVLSGGGVQTKTLDALSYHLNVVCFASKAAGIKHTGDKVFTVADDDWKGFAGAVASAAVISRPTPPSFFRTYNWRTIAAVAFEKLLNC